VLHALPDLDFNHKHQDGDQVTKFVVGIVRAFLLKHGFEKNRVNEEGIQAVILPSPASRKGKHDCTEAQLPPESSFAVIATKCGRYQTSIDPTEYTKPAGATIIHAVCVSATQC